MPIYGSGPPARTPYRPAYDPSYDPAPRPYDTSYYPQAMPPGWVRPVSGSAWTPPPAVTVPPAEELPPYEDLTPPETNGYDFWQAVGAGRTRAYEGLGPWMQDYQRMRGYQVPERWWVPMIEEYQPRSRR